MTFGEVVHRAILCRRVVLAVAWTCRPGQAKQALGPPPRRGLILPECAAPGVAAHRRGVIFDATTSSVARHVMLRRTHDVREVTDAMKIVGQAIKDGREIVAALHDSSDYLRTRYKRANKDLAGVLTEMRKTLLGLAKVYRRSLFVLPPVIDDGAGQRRDDWHIGLRVMVVIASGRCYPLCRVEQGKVPRV